LGGYYPSIRSLCSHLFILDFTWLRRFANLRSFAYAQHPVFHGKVFARSGDTLAGTLV